MKRLLKHYKNKYNFIKEKLRTAQMKNTEKRWHNILELCLIRISKSLELSTYIDL